ncbi:MAG: hypothetical protein KKB50_21405 [Planctomycetes bacterium]|nr:hypothetical protein [Planctomycetota bacterium]
MVSRARPRRYTGVFLAAVLGLFGTSFVAAQTSPGGFVTGAAAHAWDLWQAAMTAILAHDGEAAETAFEGLVQANPSPFRVALLAERTITRTSEGGAVLLFEQDHESGKLTPNAQRIAELLDAGREQMNQADDGWYFTAIGRFDVANANFRALLDSEPDPVALLEFADRLRKRQEVLLRVADNPVMGPAVREIMKLLETGELLIKADPTRIKEHIERLGGPPRAFENAVQRLKDSGEYAIPFIIQILRDPAKKELTQPVLRCLPQIDRPALNPLVMTLRMSDHSTKRYAITALGQIGYGQPVPYLLQLNENPETPEEVRNVVVAALDALRARGIKSAPDLTAAEAFFHLAEAYYEDQESLAADPRLDMANVWYWRDDLLQNIKVPTAIFNEIMCMRCCEEALLLDPNMEPALALWLAADFRREAQLEAGAIDNTRREVYPSAAYFAQAAGAEYCLLALTRAVEDGDPAVALGMIEALQKTAGAASLVVQDADGRMPLAEALSFPDRMVRIRAALALGHAKPVEPFHNYHNLMPVLSEALMLHAGARNALVVDPDETTANPIAAALRAEGYTVLIESELFAGLQHVRSELPGLDVIFIASDIPDPGLVSGLKQLRREFQFAATPTIIIIKPADQQVVRDQVRADHRLEALVPTDDPEEIRTTIARVARAVGAQPITADVGASLAQEAAEVLEMLSVTNNPLFSVADAEAALLVALGTPDARLRLTVGRTLGYLGSAAAQQALGDIALDTDEEQDMRVAMFALLADAAKRRGTHLGDEWIQRIITIAENDENMVIRTAASQTLGALNLPGNPASKIIRNQYGG